MLRLSLNGCYLLAAATWKLLEVDFDLHWRREFGYVGGYLYPNRLFTRVVGYF